MGFPGASGFQPSLLCLWCLQGTWSYFRWVLQDGNFLGKKWEASKNSTCQCAQNQQLQYGNLLGSSSRYLPLPQSSSSNMCYSVLLELHLKQWKTDYTTLSIFWFKQTLTDPLWYYTQPSTLAAPMRYQTQTKCAASSLLLLFCTRSKFQGIIWGRQVAVSTRLTVPSWRWNCYRVGTFPKTLCTLGSDLGGWSPAACGLFGSEMLDLEKNHHTPKQLNVLFLYSAHY